MTEWPRYCIDPDTGTQHSWDDQVPIDQFDIGYVGHGQVPQPYTYRDLAYDQAAAQHMDIDEYLEIYHSDDDDEKMSPGYVDD